MSGIGRWVRILVLSVVALVFVGLPLWMVIVNSLKTQGDAAQLGLGLPVEWQGRANYREVIDASRYLRSFANSVLVTGSTIVILLGVGAPAAWAFGRSTSRLLQGVYYVTIFGLLLPPAVVPTVYLMREAGLQGTHVALVLFTVGSKMALVVFLMTGFVRGLPRELEEAAALDGASSFRTFWSIVFPLMRPVILTTVVILIVLIWNDFLGPAYLLTGQDRATLPLGLYQLSSGINQASAWHLVFAHVVLVSLPLIVVYVVAQRRIVEGVTSGAVRG